MSTTKNENNYSYFLCEIKLNNIFTLKYKKILNVNYFKNSKYTKEKFWVKKKTKSNTFIIKYLVKLEQI